MNILQFEEELRKYDNYNQLMTILIPNIKNSFEYYIKTIEQDVDFEENVLGGDGDILGEYENLFIESVAEILGAIGEDATSVIQESKLNCEDIWDKYYYITIQELWDIFKKLSEVKLALAAIIFSIKFSSNPPISRLCEKIQNYTKDTFPDLFEEIKFSNEKKVFVAMWFDEEMGNARKKIENALKECGYKANLIDEKEHNNLIVPEILYEIEKSKFLVADLTGNRGGVYYEAGYAMGLNKEVILTCRQLQEGHEKPHFDVAQKNTIFWDTEEELYEKLIKRINALRL